jgi:hypothetical protein
MATFKLSLNVVVQGAPTQADLLTHARQALQMIGLEARARWADLIEQSPSIPQQQKADYVQSLTVEKAGPLQVSVYSDWKYAYEIENGRPSRDLKRMLDTSMKVRVSTSKKNAGKRYLTIPFRHSLSSMPGPVRSAARLLTKSEVTGMGKRPSGTGAWDIKTKAPLLVAQRKYKWGEKLPAGLALKSAIHHKTDRYAGMVRMNTGAGKAKSSAYLTFRTMMEGSAGWITKPVPGVCHIPQLAKDIEPMALQIIQTAVRLPAGA